MIMSWTEALESLDAHPHRWRFAELCADDYLDTPARDAYRELVIRLAAGEPLESPDEVIARVEDMALRAQAGETRGGCGGC